MIEHDLVTEDTIMSQDDIVDRALVLANRVATMVTRTQQQMVEFTGCPRDPEYNPKVALIDQERRLRLASSDDWARVVIDDNPFGRKTSYILEGLHDVIMMLKQPINHLLLRCCRNVVVCLEGGTTSGIDVLFSQGIGIEVPHHNWMNVEGTSTALIQGDLHTDTKIRIMSSLEIRINGTDLPTNPFSTVCLELSGEEPEGQRTPKLRHSGLSTTMTIIL